MLRTPIGKLVGWNIYGIKSLSITKCAFLKICFSFRYFHLLIHTFSFEIFSLTKQHCCCFSEMRLYSYWFFNIIDNHDSFFTFFFFQLQGLKSLTTCCPNLAQLNLSGVHYQTSKETPNDLLEIISKLANLVSLSLCACCCVLGSVREQRSRKSSTDFGTDLLKSRKRVCHGDGGSSRLDSYF